MPKSGSRAFAYRATHIRAMTRAFDAACALLHLSGNAGDWRSDLVATKIIELAAAGEHDASKLDARVLAEFGVDNDGTLLPH
jgi:hypothetical protein